MPPEITKEELQSRAQLVRVWESACDIEHPTATELAFREAVAKKLGTEFGLREMRGVSFTNSIVQRPTPQPITRK